MKTRMQDLVARTGQDTERLAATMVGLLNVGRVADRFELTEAIQKVYGVQFAAEVNERAQDLREKFDY